MIGTLPGCAPLSESERTGCAALSAGIAKAESMAARNTKDWELQAYLMSSCYRLVLNGQCIVMKAMAGQGQPLTLICWQSSAKQWLAMPEPKKVSFPLQSSQHT